MKKSLIPLAAVILALVATGAGVLALTGGDTPILSSEGIDPPECNQVHNIDACDQDDLAGDPGADKDSSCEPLPLRSDCGIDPDECNLVHNINACDQDDLDGLVGDSSLPVNSDDCDQLHNIDDCGMVLDPPGAFDEPSGDDSNYFQVTVQFNTSYTQDNIDEAGAFLRTFDDDLEFLVMEIFQPVGSAVLALETSDECSAIGAQLEAESYVAGVTCEPWQPAAVGDPDAAVEQDNE